MMTGSSASSPRTTWRTCWSRRRPRISSGWAARVPYRQASIPLLFRKRIFWLMALFLAEA
jgi:hypothetical protein